DPHTQIPSGQVCRGDGRDAKRRLREGRLPHGGLTMPARDPTSWMRAEYESLVAQNLDWKLRVLQGPSAPRSMVDGKSVIMLCSNNYLNRSNHAKVKRAAREAVKTHGAGSGSVRPIAGNMDLHEELERRIDRFKHREAALVYVSGFGGNAGLMSHLAGDGVVVLTDELNQGGMIDGVLGDGGRGVASHFHVEDKIQVELGTFSKALGVVGGYVAGSNDLRNFALNKSRTWLLSGSHPPAVAAACTAAIDVLETEPRHVKKLWSNTKYFKKQLVSLGFDIGRSATPITPVMLGDSAIAKRFSNRLFEEGVFALPIVFPMVAKDRARIRNIVNAGLKRQDLDEALGAYEKIGKE